MRAHIHFPIPLATVLTITPADTATFVPAVPSSLRASRMRDYEAEANERNTGLAEDATDNHPLIMTAAKASIRPTSVPL